MFWYRVWYRIVLKNILPHSLHSPMKYFSTLQEKFRISAWPCNILYLLKSHLCLFSHIPVALHPSSLLGHTQETAITYQLPLQPSESIPRLCDVLPTPNKIGLTENAKMIDRCHSSNKSDGHTLECKDTDSWTAGILERAHFPWEAS